MSALIIQIPTPSLITEGTRIQGDLTFQSNTEIHGTVEGDVHQHALEPIQVGRTGWIKGSLSAAGPVLVEGRVEGDISSLIKIRLSATACVHGTLNAPQIEVRPGAIFEGEFRMKSEKKAKPQATSKRAA